MLTVDSTRDEVVAHILQQWAETASLANILRGLCLVLEPPDEDEEDERAKSAAPPVEEMFELLRAPSDQRDVLVIRILWAAGLRTGELCKLRVADYDSTVGTLFVRGGKGDKDRYVLLDPVTNRLLQAYVWNQPPQSPIFSVGKDAVRHAISKWARKIGLVQKYKALGLRFSPHSIRHCFATHLYRGGMRVESVQYLLGHEEVATTGLYIHGDITVWSERFHDALDRVSPPPPGAAPAGRLLPDSGTYRAEVVEWILRHVPPEGRLEDVVAALGQLRLLEMPTADRELVDVLSGEVSFPDLVLGSRLPLSLSSHWIEQLSSASGAPVLVQFLSGSGVLPHDLPGLSEFDYRTGIFKVGGRYAVVDRDTARLVRQHPEALQVTPAAVEALLLEAARKIGLVERYAALDRRFTSNCLRYYYASRLCEARMDMLALHNLLGNLSSATTQAFAAASPLAYQAEYLKCHPLAVV